jgi:phosphohistidine swiveling domain-containing protein
MCQALQRLLALRDECRHVTTLLVTHLRSVVLELGRRAAAQGALGSADDAFFLLWEELPVVLTDRRCDWRSLTLRRRAARERHARSAAPNLLGGPARADDAAAARPGDELVGFGVSPGTVRGTIRVMRSVADAGRLSGEIVVFPAIEPTLATIYPLVGGIVTEMGGLLSHAAILAREYGLPAVVNVEDATRRLHDGDRVELDGTTGRVRLLERAG